MRRSPSSRPWRPDFRGTTGVSLSSPSYLVRNPNQALHLEKTHEMPPSSRDEGLLFLHGLESQASSFLEDGTPLASRVVLEVTGHLSSCVCNLPVFPMMHRCVSAPSCCTFILKAAFQEVSEHRILIKSGPGNWSLSASGTTHKATYRISP